MIRASQADLPQITAFLHQHDTRAMFPLSNLSRYGLDDDAPRSSRIWVARKDGAISDVMTVTMEGMAMPLLPSANYAEAASVTAGLPLIGIIGPADHARGLEAALNLQSAASSLNRDEPQMALSLAEMTVPDGIGKIVPLAHAPQTTIKDWMADYQRGALQTPENDVQKRVDGSYGFYLANESHVVLMDGDTPLAMTGFNARLPEIVQIGGVYTPPALRGKGYARRALALHLSQVKSMGVKRATLFSASEMAERSYAGIGFQRIGFWTLLLFEGKAVGHV